MSRSALSALAAAAIGLACDDPDVQAKAVDVLEHGVVAAHVACSTSINWTGIGSGLETRVDIKRLLDGASFTRTQCDWDPASASGMCERNEPCAATGELAAPLGNRVLTVWADGGEVHIEPSGESVIDLDIETQCTGFNLDAFD